MKKNIVIGIEGMVASGKTSICKELLKLIPNSIFIDAGEIYRGIVEAIKQSRINFEEEKLSDINPFEIMKKLQVEFKIEDKITRIYIKGKKVDSKDIESIENSMEVSIMASKTNHDSLYKFARMILDTYREKFNIILSARDLVTLYPDMTCHIYITADLDVRIERRYRQYNGKYDKKDIEKMIKKRDDLHKGAGFNKLYDKSIKVDVTKCSSAEESAKKVLSSIGGYINELHK